MTVKAWRDRFAEDGLKDFSSVRPGRGRKPSIPAEKVEEIVRLTLHETPAGETHWSCRTMAARAGVSPATVQRIWSARGLAAASRRDVQALKRPPVRGEARRCRRPVSEPAGERDRALHGREEPDPGAGPHPAVAADQARPGRNDDPRLQAQRHHDPVRRAGRPDRLGDRPVPAPPPPRRVPEVPADDRSRGPQAPARSI